MSKALLRNNILRNNIYQKMQKLMITRLIMILSIVMGIMGHKAPGHPEWGSNEKSVEYRARYREDA